ncbi:hypothetical protein MNBD_PLANCTO03-1884 [hydrothermal vent metagenome]|uniref:Peptidase S9 prolyl oligopeptidase catalytic domain-containing protein n=1 Tax=hydrothermal vent metagenome TaxID=652676 RepID=A0A3B1DND4_9ZZZZ
MNSRIFSCQWGGRLVRPIPLRLAEGVPSADEAGEVRPPSSLREPRCTRFSAAICLFSANFFRFGSLYSAAPPSVACATTPSSKRRGIARSGSRWPGSPSRLFLCIAALLLPVLTSFTVPICAAQSTSAAAAPESLPWPTREAVLVEEIKVGPWALRGVGGLGLGWEAADIADAAAVAEMLDGQKVRFEDEGSIVVRMPEGTLSSTARIAGKPVAAYKFLSADAREDGVVQLQRTWFVLYAPRDTDEEAAVSGVVLLLPGMFGTPEPVIDSLVGMLRDRGWHVLRMLTHSSRFTEKAGYTLDPEGDLEGVAGAIADELGDRAVECALAVEAVGGYIAKTRPDIPIATRIALGMSGGGMVLPTIVAREPGAYSAAVFIGAGCDFAAIGMESNYADWIDAVRIGWKGEAEGSTASEAADRFTELYRQAATFDSYNTAPRMADLPTLMLHGSTDKAVPAALGELLWQRLGEPERWSAPVGHEMLFMAFVPSKTTDLLDWMEEALK